ncbi:hypothetical protein CYMTET_30382, partial [Cymbomonas tetramitiformis]
MSSSRHNIKAQGLTLSRLFTGILLVFLGGLVLCIYLTTEAQYSFIKNTTSRVVSLSRISLRTRSSAPSTTTAPIPSRAQPPFSPVFTAHTPLSSSTVSPPVPEALHNGTHDSDPERVLHSFFEEEGVKLRGATGEEVSQEDGEEVSQEDGEEVSQEDGEEVSQEDGEEVSQEDGEEVSQEDGEKVSQEDGEEVSQEHGEKVSQEDGEEVSQEDGEKVSEQDGQKAPGDDASASAEDELESSSGMDNAQEAAAAEDGDASEDALRANCANFVDKPVARPV